MKNNPKSAPAEPQAQSQQAQQEPQADEKAKDSVVSVQAFQEFQDGVTGTLRTITSTLENLATRPQQQAQPQQQQAPQITDISDEDLETALISGDGGAKAIRKAIKAEAERLYQERIVPLEQYGVQTFNELSERVVGKDQKHYNLLRKEVDQQLAQMDPALRASPRARDFAYKMAVAENMDRIVQAEVEAKLRTTADDEAGLTQRSTSDRGVGTRTDGKQKQQQSPMEVFGNESLKALRSVGRDMEHMAKRMGYKNADEYMKLAEETYGFEEEEE